MPVDDPQQFKQGLRDERRRLNESTEIHDRDRERIREWMRARDGTIAVSSLATYCRRLRLASELASRPLVEFDEADFQELVFALRHEQEYADATVQSYENALLLFLDDVLNVDWPSDVERTRVDTTTVTEEDILEQRDIQALLEACSYERDVAFIEFLADTGARLSLALSLRVGDVALDGETPTYTPNKEAIGLKGAPITEYPLIDSAAALRSYLRTSHPRPNTPGVALFHKIKPASRDPNGQQWPGDGSLGPNAARQQLYRIADRADVSKPVRPHAFRHAAITRMVREGYSRSQIEHRVHWTLDSDMWETYEHITGSAHTRDIFRAAGVLEDEGGPSRERHPCGQCGMTLAPHHEFCPQCGQPATRAARESKATAVTQLSASMAELDEMSKREFRAFVVRQLTVRPETVLPHADDPPDSSSGSR